MVRNEKGRQKALEIAQFLWPWLVELWIFVAIASFFIIRVLGSNFAQHFLGGIKKIHFP